MLPIHGSVVATASGMPQPPVGSSPFSGHGGAGGWIGPSGASVCCCQYARWAWASRFALSMRIGLADAATAVAPRMPVTTSAVATARSEHLFIYDPLV